MSNGEVRRILKMLRGAYPQKDYFKIAYRGWRTHEELLALKVQSQETQLAQFLVSHAKTEESPESLKVFIQGYAQIKFDEGDLTFVRACLNMEEVVDLCVSVISAKYKRSDIPELRKKKIWSLQLQAYYDRAVKWMIENRCTFKRRGPYVLGSGFKEYGELRFYVGMVPVPDCRESQRFMDTNPPSTDFTWQVTRKAAQFADPIIDAQIEADKAAYDKKQRESWGLD